MADFQVQQLVQYTFIDTHVPVCHFEAGLFDAPSVAGNVQPVLITKAGMGVAFRKFLLGNVS